MEVAFKKLDPRAHIPTYGSDAAAGADLYAVADGDVVIGAGQTVFLHTGLSLSLPEGYAGLVFARSSLGTKRGLAPANKVGVIDSDYRGEILVALHNHGGEAQSVAPGERIAQLLIVPIARAVFVERETLDETGRGAGGFGSTGRN